jgi:hypothetical protein
MLLKNINPAQGLVNGAKGRIVGFTNDDEHLPIVEFASGVRQSIVPEEWAVETSERGRTVKKAARIQVPLKLGWAITIHKSQGMGLEWLEVKLDDVFEEGQAYVALSRAIKLEGLRVVAFRQVCTSSLPPSLPPLLPTSSSNHTHTTPSFLPFLPPSLPPPRIASASLLASSPSTTPKSKAKPGEKPSTRAAGSPPSLPTGGQNTRNTRKKTPPLLLLLLLTTEGRREGGAGRGRGPTRRGSREVSPTHISGTGWEGGESGCRGIII